MAEVSEWKIKEACLTIEKAIKEFDVHPDFITNGINIGKLEFLRGTTKAGRPWTKILRNQLEFLINEDQMGALHLVRMRSKKELTTVNKDINFYKNKLEYLIIRKAQIDVWLAQNQMTC